MTQAQEVVQAAAVDADHETSQRSISVVEGEGLDPRPGSQ
jgi:hypothetical protein